MCGKTDKQAFKSWWKCVQGNKDSWAGRTLIQSETVKMATHTSSAFFTKELHRDSPVVTSGELHQTCEHQVANVEVLMEFNPSKCHLTWEHHRWAGAVSLNLHKSLMLWNCSYDVGGSGKLSTCPCSGIGSFIKILKTMYLIWFLFYFYSNMI